MWEVPLAFYQVKLFGADLLLELASNNELILLRMGTAIPMLLPDVYRIQHLP